MLNNIEYSKLIYKKISDNTICLEDIDLKIIDAYSNCFELITDEYNNLSVYRAWENFKHDFENTLLDENNITIHIKKLTCLFDTISYCMRRLNNIDIDAVVSMNGLLCSLKNLLESYEVVNKLTC